MASKGKNLDKINAERASLEKLIEAAGENPTSMALKIGRSKDHLRDFLSGRKNSITAADWKEIERLANANAGESTTASSETAVPEPQFLLKRDLKVYAAVEGGPGEMLVSNDPVEIVQRPWYVQHVKDAYAVIVVGTSMEPAFEAGDMAIVNPRLPAVRGKDAIFIATQNGGDWRATIKRLVRTTEKEFIVAQFNPPKELKLLRSEWRQALRVVGKYTG